MKKARINFLDFEVDRLTRSIENVATGDSFATEVLRLTKTDLKQVTKKNGWNFDWKTELADNRKEVFKLAIPNNPGIIQGLLSLTLESDHVYMHLLENAPYNIGQNKLYEGVGGNLFAFGCKVSKECGFGGFVSFIAKSALMEYYNQTLGATRAIGQRMVIVGKEAEILINRYFKRK